MSCESIRGDLVAFHFGLSTAEERGAIEAHVMACRACLRELLDLKRAIETGEDGPRPSAAARDRLRAAVADAIRPAPAPRRRWERPVAFAFAASALLASMIAMHSLTDPPKPPATPSLLVPGRS